MYFREKNPGQYRNMEDFLLSVFAHMFGGGREDVYLKYIQATPIPERKAKAVSGTATNTRTQKTYHITLVYNDAGEKKWCMVVYCSDEDFLEV